ncbi:RagB/SusD family nutrient uptake outer membrane protein [Pontibacter fetidus]|uniref:RagB/SusD family nutrient uptake outer membrane protein n=1 Tax=Pontibacter fetidus TaxID=2700082 RepID=A0A6B2H1K5_9BACT|nr:RagB/SusD family nutrient uptake outer membrane protein [Pontibacter fetidus]NDK56241.1 RagB/SusD family nutrient uptake outer membrane protein [Pontibacter fetidus]
MKRYSYLLMLFLGLSMFSGCEDTLDIDPTTGVDIEEAITDEVSLNRAALGTYSALQDFDYYGLRYLLYQDVYADNMQHRGTFTTDVEVSTRDIKASNLQLASTWAGIYTTINRANIVIRGAEQLDNIEEETRNRYIAEMRFIRALAHFDLLRVFGGVPVITSPTTTIPEIQNVARSSEAEVYNAVIADLLFAEENLGNAISNAPYRASSLAATALLARVYLQQGNNAAAEASANTVIESGQFELLENFSDLWVREGNAESIFELNFTPYDANGLGSASDPRTGGQKFYLRQAFFDEFAASAAEGDLRFEQTTRFEGNRNRLLKYEDVSENADNVPIIRLAEMYLIRAEARARQGAALAPADPQVISDINMIRRRAGLTPVVVLTNAQALQEILEQRRFEFVGEGMRFMDLKRYNLTCERLGFCEADGEDFRNLWPIPLQQIEVNPELDQNPGY